MPDAAQSVKHVPVDNMQFDPQNPRLPTSIDRTKEPAVLDWLLKDASGIIELMGSIGAHDYFQGEPLLVVRIPKHDGFTVVEGNRRLAAVKLLRNPDLAPPHRRRSITAASQAADHKPDVLPVLEFGTRNDILDYLGYRHITGIEEWDPLAKARYLKQLFSRVRVRDQAVRFQELARSIGSRADYVARLLTGLAVYETIEQSDFFGIEGLGEESIRFSWITTALSYNTIARFLGLASAVDPTLGSMDAERLEELSKWLFDKVIEGRWPRVRESRRLKELAAVVDNEAALEAFRHGTPLEDAAMLTALPLETFRAAIVEAKINLKLARDHIHRIDSLTESDAETLDEILRMGQDLQTLVQTRLTRAN